MDSLAPENLKNNVCSRITAAASRAIQLATSRVFGREIGVGMAWWWEPEVAGLFPATIGRAEAIHLKRLAFSSAPRRRFLDCAGPSIGRSAHFADCATGARSPPHI